MYVCMNVCIPRSVYICIMHACMYVCQNCRGDSPFWLPTIYATGCRPMVITCMYRRTEGRQFHSVYPEDRESTFPIFRFVRSTCRPMVTSQHNRWIGKPC